MARTILLSGYGTFTIVVAASALGFSPLHSQPFAVALLTISCFVAAIVARRSAAADGCEPSHAALWIMRGYAPTSEANRGAQEPRSDLSGEAPREDRGMRALALAATILTWAALAATSVAIALAVSLPVGAYDALGYRLPAVAQWLDAGAVAWVVGDDPLRNGYPLALEVLEAALFRAFDSAAGVDALAPLFVLAGAGAVAAFAREVGAATASAWLGGALFALVPMHLLNGPSGYADAAFAGALVFTLVAAVRFVFARERSRWLAIDLGVAGALTIALKPHGFAFAGLALAFAAVGRLRAERRAGVRELGTVAALLAPGCFFTARNVLVTGNPLYPLEVKLFGRVLFAGESSLEGILTPAFNVPAELASLPAFLRPLYVWLQPGGAAVSFDDRLAGLGYLFPLLALPALAWLVRALLRSDRAREPRAVASLLALTCSCFVLQPFAFWPRFTSWLWGAGGVAVALLFTALARSLHTREAAGLLALTIAVALPEAVYALVHVKSLHRLGLAAWSEDANTLLARVSGLNSAFLERALLGKRDVCRTPWRLGTDDANLDGIVAQLSPRPRMHVIEESTLTAYERAVRARGCSELIAIGDPPFLATFSSELRGRVETATAFGRCHLVSMSVSTGVAP